MALERSFKKDLALVAVPAVFKAFFQICGPTFKTQWIGSQELDNLIKEKQNWVFSLWHNNISTSAWVLRDQNLMSMVSSSWDGELIARALHLMGNTTIRGSSSRGGTKALLQMIKALKTGQNAAITPDGPRGPLYSMQKGTIIIAQMAGVPLVPIHMELSKQWVFSKSWDKHRLPKPFSTIVITVGKPFWVPKKLNETEFEEIRTKFLSIMLENTRFAEKIVTKLRN